MIGKFGIWFRRVLQYGGWGGPQSRGLSPTPPPQNVESPPMVALPPPPIPQIFGKLCTYLLSLLPLLFHLEAKFALNNITFNYIFHI